VILAVDQAYGEFDDQPPGAIFALTDHGNTVVLRTFSKAYALAAARVGRACFLRKLRPGCVNC
jgi:histidinol-phosphate aminotransferase